VLHGFRTEVLASESNANLVKVYWEEIRQGNLQFYFPVAGAILSTPPTAAEIVTHLASNPHITVVTSPQPGKIGDFRTFQEFAPTPTETSLPTLETRVGNITAAQITNISVIGGNVWIQATNVKYKWSATYHWDGTKVGDERHIIWPEPPASYPAFP
jgi:hypothetical protein